MNKTTRTLNVSQHHFDLTRLFKFFDDDKNIILYKYYVSCLLGSSLNMIMMDRKYSKIIQNGNLILKSLGGYITEDSFPPSSSLLPPSPLPSPPFSSSAGPAAYPSLAPFPTPGPPGYPAAFPTRQPAQVRILDPLCRFREPL